MKKSIWLFSAVVVCFLTACMDDCPDCVPPPATRNLLLEDQMTGENLISNGTYPEQSLEAVDVNSEKNFDLRFEGQDSFKVMLLNFGWEEGVYDIHVESYGQLIFRYQVQIGVIEDECCDAAYIESESVSEAGYKSIDEFNLLKIFL